MIDGTPHEEAWDKMSTEDVQHWAHTLRSWKQAMRQDTPSGKRIRHDLKRSRRIEESHPDTVDLEDYR